VFVKVACNFHPHEVAYVAVIDNPFFAVTSPDGRFRLPKGLPPGDYQVTTAHPNFAATTREIHVTGSRGVMEVNLTIGRATGAQTRTASPPGAAPDSRWQCRAG
jgi:hypothetical protein